MTRKSKLLTFWEVIKKFRKKIGIAEIFSCSAYLLSICGLIFYIFGIVDKYFINPTIGLSEKFMQAKDIPFPALTICSPLVIRGNLTNLLKYYENYILNGGSIIKMSSSEQNFLAAKAQVCTLVFYKMIDEGTKNRTEYNFVKLLDQGAPSVDETFFRCSNRYSTVECNLMLSRVLTDLGMCYTFNMQSYNLIFNKGVSNDFNSYNNSLQKEHWNIEKGFKSKNKNKIPYRCILGSGFQFFMTVNETDLDDLCPLLKSTFKVIFHLPNEIPTFFHYAEFLNFQTESIIKLTAKVYQNHKQLKKYSVKMRNCFFQGERKLQFFKSYTKAHCNFECLTNFTLRRCGCVKFSFPRAQGTRVCNVNESGCHMQAFNDWPEHDEMSQNYTMPCNCLSPCTDIKYEIKQKQRVDLNEKSSLFVRQYVKIKK